MVRVIGWSEILTFKIYNYGEKKDCPLFQFRQDGAIPRMPVFHLTKIKLWVTIPRDQKIVNIRIYDQNDNCCVYLDMKILKECNKALLMGNKIEKVKSVVIQKQYTTLTSC